MWKTEDSPRWLNRVAHSVASCLVGFVLGSALFARPRFVESVATPATGLAIIYGVSLAVFLLRRLAISARGPKAGSA